MGRGGHGGGATTTGPDATYPPTICQNPGGGGLFGGGRLEGVWGGVRPRGGFPRWGGLRATHYYHMHTSTGDVRLGVWGYGGMYPGGAAGPGPCMRPPQPPPRVLRDSGLGAPPPFFCMTPTVPPFFSVCFLFIRPSMLLSARYRKTRRYTNVVCCPNLVPTICCPNLPVLLRKPGQSLNPRFVAWCIMVTPGLGFDF